MGISVDANLILWKIGVVLDTQPEQDIESSKCQGSGSVTILIDYVT